MMDPPVSVLFVDNTKNGRLAEMLQEEEKRSPQGWPCQDYCQVQTLGAQETVGERTVASAAKEMRSSKTVGEGASSTRASARPAR